MLLLAEATGTLQRHDVTVTTSLTRSSTEQMRGIIEGAWDIGFTALDNVVAWGGEGELVVLCQAERTTPLRLFARRDIASIADLRGKDLGVDAPTTAFALVLRTILASAGIADAEQRLVAIGGTKERLDALLAGQVAATLLNPPFDERARAAGLRELARAQDALPDYPGVVCVALRRSARERTDVLAPYLAALLDAAAWGAAPENEPEALRVLMERGLPEAAAREQLALLVSDLEVDAAGVRSVLAVREAVYPGTALEPAIDRGPLEIARRMRGQAAGPASRPPSPPLPLER